MNAKNEVQSKLTKGQWYLALAEALVNNPFALGMVRDLPAMDNHALDPSRRRDGAKQAHCVMCRKRTWHKCMYGRAVCHITRREEADGRRGDARNCHADHQALVRLGDQNHVGPPKRRKGPVPQV